MTIKTRLLAGMITIGGIFLVPLIAGVLTLDRMRDQITLMRDREFAASVLLARVRSNVDVIRRAEPELTLHPAQSTISDVQGQIRKLSAMGSLLDSYGLGTSTDSLRAALQDVALHLPLTDEARASASLTAAAPLSSAMNRADRAIGAAERSLRESTDRRVSQVVTAMQRAQWMLVISLLVAGVLTLTVAVGLSDFVDRPLKALERGMGRVADGEFDQSLGISSTRRDEFGRLASAFTSMATRLKELEQMRASWLAIGSHELKNEVGPIIGYMDLLTDGILGTLTPKQLEKCQRTKTLAVRLKGHLLKYLAVSQMEAGGHQLSLSQFDLGDFLNEVESDFGAMAGTRNVAFTVIRPAMFSRWVNWDREGVREILENLLSNAFKFTPAGGSVIVTSDEVVDVIRLSVKDTGAGIPAEDVTHVFGKYFKARNQSKSPEKGTGLGLAIVQEMIRAHGGSIRCDSVLGEGTTFTVVLPFDASSQTTTRIQHTQPESIVHSGDALVS
jgi:signal transduction histidine kinase